MDYHPAYSRACNRAATVRKRHCTRPVTLPHGRGSVIRGNDRECHLTRLVKIALVLLFGLESA
jgi:hypothetical protein